MQKSIELQQAITQRQWELIDHIRQHHGHTVQSGPFKGLILPVHSHKPDWLSKFFGVYEHELHGVIQTIINTPYQNIIDIGCADGYYVTGLARAMPNTQVYGYDIADDVKALCEEGVTRNQLTNVKLGGWFDGQDFDHFSGQRTLVICDIEGAELDVLIPEQYKSLQHLDVLVEMHDCYRSDISDVIVSRFKYTHDIQIIRNGYQYFDVLPWLGKSFPGFFQDNLIATWESRQGPTPWAYMTAKG